MTTPFVSSVEKLGVAIQGAWAGKHLLIEKPVVFSPDELARMDAAVTKAQVKTVVSFVLRWNPLVLTIKRLTQDGAFGHTFFVQTSYWHNVVQGGYPGAKPGPNKSPVSAMLGGGCHAMDMTRYLMDSDITHVTALTKDTVQGHASPANTAAVVKFANGAMGYVSACTEQWMPYVFNIDLFGGETDHFIDCIRTGRESHVSLHDAVNTHEAC